MKNIFVLIFLVIISSCNKQNKNSNISIKKEQFLDQKSSYLVNETAKTLMQSDKKVYAAFELSFFKNKVFQVTSKDPQNKGSRYEAHNLKEQLAIYRTKSLDISIHRKIDELFGQVDKFLAGKKQKVNNEAPITSSEPFNNSVRLIPTEIPDSPSDDMKSRLSIFKEYTNWISGEIETYSCSGITLTPPDPQGDPLTASDFITDRTSEMENLANSFETVEELFKYVRDNIKPWPVFGATQSAVHTLQSKVGTYIDKTALLVTLLRTRGIAAQFVFGDVLVDEEKLKGIYGVEGKYDLFWAVADTLYDYWKKDGKGAIYYQNGRRTWLIPHAWVYAYIEGQWRTLDPSNIYYEYGSQNPAFRRFDLNIDLDGYLVGKNVRGQYEKSGTIVDYVLETAGDEIRTTFGSGLSFKNLDLTNYGKSITPEVDGIPYGTMAYNGGGCAFHQTNLIPSNFIPKFSLKMKKVGAVVFDKEFDLPEIFEKGLFTIHDAGLLTRVGDQSGNLKIYLGKDKIGSVPARTTDRIDLNYSLEQYPREYMEGSTIGDDTKSINAAGEVYSFMVYEAPTTKDRLEREVEQLRLMLGSNQPENIIYAQFLQVANILTVLQKYEQNKLNHILTTTGGGLGGVFYTYGKSAIVKDQDDRPYGAVPLGTGIDWLSMPTTYSRSGNFSSYSDYTNIANSNLISILCGSQIEANIWEILYGVPGGSSTKIMNLIAKDVFEEGRENIIVSDQQLGVGNDSTILAMFNDVMADFAVSGLAYTDTFVKYKSIIYSHTKEYQKDNGYRGKALLILPTDPRSGALALYTGKSSPVGDLRTQGGGATGDAVIAMPAPTKVDINDPQLPGASYSCNPVSHSTGDMFHTFADFTIKGRTANSSIKFERKYSTKPYKPLGDLGPDWTHNFQTRLVTDNFDTLRTDIQGDIVWIKEGGNQVVFSRNQDGTYSAPAGIRDKLEEYNDHFKLVLKGGNFYLYNKDNSDAPAGRLLYFEEVHGEKISTNYDSNGLLEYVEAPFAGRVEFNYDAQNRISSIYRVRDDLMYTFTYNGDGYLEASVDFDNNTTQYEYVLNRKKSRAQGLLHKIIDPLNQEIQFEYYDDGRVFQEIGKGGAKTTYYYSYFMVDHLTRVRAENGATKLYKFDDKFRLIETEYEDGSRIKQVWDDDSNMVASVDELGYKTEFLYDERGNKTGVMAPEYSGYIRTEYHPEFDKPTRIIPLLGATTQNTFDEATGDLLKTEKLDSLGFVFLEYVNDPFGNPVTTINNETSYSDVRDSNGFLKTKYDLRNPVSMEYDVRGRVVKKTYVSGKIEELVYDNHDRVVEIHDNVGPDTINGYDVLGRLISKTITDGITPKTTLYEYDSRDRQIAVVDPLGRRTEKKYDLPGLGCKYVIDKPVAVVDPSGRVTKMEYDHRNRDIRTVSPEGTVTRKEYNDRGDLIAITDGDGNRSTFLYDGNSRLVKKTRPAAKSANNGDVQAGKEVTYLKYDEADRLVREEKLLAGIQNGSEVAKLVTENEYNEQGQLVKKITKKEFMGQEQILDESTFSYRRLMDAPSQLSANNNNTLLSFTYENRPPFALTNYTVAATDTQNPLGIVEGEFNIENDITGGIKKLYQTGTTNPIFENEHDAAGRLTKKTSRYNGYRLVTDVGYDSFYRKLSIVHDSGLQASYSYDLLDRILSITYVGEGYNLSQNLTYDLLTGNVTKVSRELGDINLTYDEKDQLTSVTYNGNNNLGPLIDRNLTYDRSGNRLVDTFSGDSEFVRGSIVGDQNYFYYSDTNGFGNIVQKTDKQSGAQHVYEYWNDGKLRKFTKYERVPNLMKTLEVDYYFDALGRRVAKKIKTRSNDFTQTYSSLANQDKILIAKSGDDKTQLQVDGQGIDEHLAEINDAGVKTFTSNHLDTVLNSEVTNEHNLTGVFGELLQMSAAIEATSNPVIYGFTGRQFDPEINMYYYRNRMYDQQSGRFMTPDPKGIEGGDTNLYRYVKNSPLMYSDPDGKQSQTKIESAELGAELANSVKTLYEVWHQNTPEGKIEANQKWNEDANRATTLDNFVNGGSDSILPTAPISNGLEERKTCH